jgi:hypothetical protein
MKSGPNNRRSAIFTKDLSHTFSTVLAAKKLNSTSRSNSPNQSKLKHRKTFSDGVSLTKQFYHHARQFDNRLKRENYKPELISAECSL